MVKGRRSSRGENCVVTRITIKYACMRGEDRRCRAAGLVWPMAWEAKGISILLFQHLLTPYSVQD
jgi:hypothetical protein